MFVILGQVFDSWCKERCNKFGVPFLFQASNEAALEALREQKFVKEDQLDSLKFDKYFLLRQLSIVDPKVLSSQLFLLFNYLGFTIFFGCYF